MPAIESAARAFFVTMILTLPLAAAAPAAAAAQELPAEPAAVAQATEPASLETVVKELRAIREQQAELALSVKKIEKLLESSELPAAGLEFPLGPNAEALQEITLPDQATKEQVRQYIREIMKISEWQNSFSSSDPQVRMLAMVGPGNMDILLLELRMTDKGELYLVMAIAEVAQDENDRNMILAALPTMPELVGVIVAKGWEPEARNTLVDALRARPTFLPAEWIDAVASLRDPNTYELLKDYLVNGDNPWSTYESIRWLPDFDLKRAVAEMWDKHKDEEDRDNWGKARMAMIAAEYGHLDALQKVVSLLVGDTNDLYYTPQARLTLYRLTDARGTNEEIRKWFDKNKDKLVFDAKEKKFVVKGAQ